MRLVAQIFMLAPNENSDDRKNLRPLGWILKVVGILAFLAITWRFSRWGVGLW